MQLNGDLKEWPYELISGTVNPTCEGDLSKEKPPSNTKSSLFSSACGLVSSDCSMRTTILLNYYGKQLKPKC